MNIAYCIICHDNTPILRECINILGQKNDIYIHVDKKSNIEKFTEYKDKVTFATNRIDVKWGSFSQVEATLELLSLTKVSQYDYIFLLSGDCLPLKSDIEIKDKIRENYGKIFIAQDKEFNYNSIVARVKYHYNFIDFKKNKNYCERKIITLINKFHLRKKNTYFEDLPKLYKGTQWFGITYELRDYIFDFLNENPNYIRAFQYSYCADEVFFHTIIFNSDYKNYIYTPIKDENICYQALRYIDWKSGPEYPKLLTESDFENIDRIDCLFARKFSKDLDLNKFKEFFHKGR